MMPRPDINPKEEPSIRHKRRQTAPKLDVAGWEGVPPQPAEARRTRATVVRLLHVCEDGDAVR